ncbi:MAG: AAA family ATPase [Campylobacterota bacterium]|nr:AAA family ATPase [Campylobacterota bacterium]
MKKSSDLIAQAICETAKIIQGKDEQVKLALAVFLAKGHLLIEDLPGVGKTMLAKTLSRVLGLGYSRVQFTSDLLPSDILGINYFDTKSSSFIFKKGPLFTQFLLADEINRATPKTQSALLEAMEEHQVSIDAKTMPLPEPFFVIATKNPFEEVGTFELPDSQLDRFMLSFSLGYPSHKAERSILRAKKHYTPEELIPLESDAIIQLQDEAANIHLSDALLDYLQEILDFTRSSGLYKSGLSTRGAISLTNLAKAWALIEGRDFVTPADISYLLPFVTSHRLKSKSSSADPKEIANEILANVHPDS